MAAQNLSAIFQSAAGSESEKHRSNSHTQKPYFYQQITSKMELPPCGAKVLTAVLRPRRSAGGRPDRLRGAGVGGRERPLPAVPLRRVVGHADRTTQRNAGECSRFGGERGGGGVATSDAKIACMTVSAKSYRREETAPAG